MGGAGWFVIRGHFLSISIASWPLLKNLSAFAAFQEGAFGQKNKETGLSVRAAACEGCLLMAEIFEIHGKMVYIIYPAYGY